MIAARSWPVIVVSLLVLGLGVGALFTPWYHLRQDLWTVVSDRQFALGEITTVVIASSGSASFEQSTQTSYDAPSGFIGVGDLMQIESAILIAVLVLQVVFVMTCIAGARRAAILVGSVSLALLTVCWVVFLASIEGAVNSSDWVREPGNGPISGFTGSSEVEYLGIQLTTTWGPLVGWFLLVLGSILQLGALSMLILKGAPPLPAPASSTTLN